MGEQVLVHHGMPEYLLLKHIGIKVPHPMLTYYDWHGGKPFGVQRATCGMMTSCPRSYVLNDMGTGKSKAALWSWDYLNQNKYAKKVLIVAPLSTLRFVWAREAFATVPDRKVAVLHGTKARRIELLNSDAEIFIINHDGVKVIADELLKRDDIDTLVLDELAVYRNNSDRSKLMRKLAQHFNFVWGMTGRPMPNKPTDVWSQCRIVTPHTVPKYFNQVRDMLMTHVSQYVWVPKDNAVDQAFNFMQPQVRFALDDVVELPECISRTIDVELSPEQAEAYNKMAKAFQIMIAEKKITAVNAGAAMNKLLQVSLGWVYTSAPEFVSIPNRPRTDALLDLVRSAAHKTIVFVPYRHALAGLSKIFENEEIDHAVVHGDVKDRDRIFNLFQNTSRYTTLLCHPECVAHGLTLTAADTTIWASPTASLDIYEQANARIRRVGQKHKQQFLHLQATPVEKKLYKLLGDKQKIQDQLLSLFEDATERRE
jgi:SNF2 family DNA or RNA helicase